MSNEYTIEKLENLISEPKKYAKEIQNLAFEKVKNYMDYLADSFGYSVEFKDWKAANITARVSILDNAITAYKEMVADRNEPELEVNEEEYKRLSQEEIIDRIKFEQKLPELTYLNACDYLSVTREQWEKLTTAEKYEHCVNNMSLQEKEKTDLLNQLSQLDETKNREKDTISVDR